MDISGVAIARNQKAFAHDPNYSFAQGDSASAELPSSQLIVCRETLNHLKADKAKAIIKNCMSSAQLYVAFTDNSTSTTNPPDADRKLKLKDSDEVYRYTEWNLALSPLSLPEPYARIPEIRGRFLNIYRVEK